MLDLLDGAIAQKELTYHRFMAIACLHSDSSFFTVGELK